MFSVVYGMREIGLSTPRAQPHFKNWGCQSFLFVPTNVQLYSGQRRRGREMGRGFSPLQPTKESGERRKLSQRGLGQRPAANNFEAFHVQFYAILRMF